MSTDAVLQLTFSSLRCWTTASVFSRPEDFCCGLKSTNSLTHCLCFSASCLILSFCFTLHFTLCTSRSLYFHSAACRMCVCLVFCSPAASPELPPRYLLGQGQRPNTITHVCWYRTQNLSLTDYLRMNQVLTADRSSLAVTTPCTEKCVMDAPHKWRFTCDFWKESPVSPDTGRSLGWRALQFLSNMKGCIINLMRLTREQLFIAVKH